MYEIWSEGKSIYEALDAGGPGNNFPHGSFCEYHFLLLPSFPSPTFPFSQVPTPKKEGRERAELSNSIFRLFQFALHHDEREAIGRERQSLSEWLWQQLARRQINRDEDGWMDVAEHES